MKKLIAIFLLLFLVVACTSTYDAHPAYSKPKKVSSRYIGKKIILFILNNGAPYSKISTSNNHFIYLWRSETKWFEPHKKEDEIFLNENQICKLRIYTNSKKIITNIVAENNDRQNLSVDACRDYL